MFSLVPIHVKFCLLTHSSKSRTYSFIQMFTHLSKNLYAHLLKCSLTKSSKNLQGHLLKCSLICSFTHLSIYSLVPSVINFTLSFSSHSLSLSLTIFITYSITILFWYPLLTHYFHSLHAVSAQRQKGLTGYCFKYTDKPFCL